MSPWGLGGEEGQVELHFIQEAEKADYHKLWAVLWEGVGGDGRLSEHAETSEIVLYYLCEEEVLESNAESTSANQLPLRGNQLSISPRVAGLNCRCISSASRC